MEITKCSNLKKKVNKYTIFGFGKITSYDYVIITSFLGSFKKRKIRDVIIRSFSRWFQGRCSLNIIVTSFGGSFKKRQYNNVIITSL